MRATMPARMIKLIPLPRPYSSICFMNAGQGATQHRDGYSVLSFPSNLGNTPIEVFEQQAPLRVIERSIRRWSGGEGQHRGGGGLHFEIEDPSKLWWAL